ncbi:MAG: 3-hydroxyisobutyrate dehydrogenase [Gammaproteobacteria bacterium RIFCSPHIGHO2_12_FULL_38_11]|nr:MAG: 3-hydroxyisobutyrate dehydrogenase [Gammaproteobacteria bacterium RIFCSPHIGHO2_12_FULL_38_11]
MTTIGFIGLGHMGNPMSSHLLGNEYRLFVYDISKKAVEALVEKGAIASESPRELAIQCDVIITSLQKGEQVSQICLGDNGIFKHAKPNLLYVDCSSIDITTTLKIHEEAKNKNIAMLDAPVSGGVMGAEAASLTIMVGGSEKHFNQALPILNKMGKKVIHAGQAGLGGAAKICNNLLLGISMIGVSEAFSLAQKLGLDAKKFFDISSNASGQCWSMTSYCPVPDILPHVPSSHNYQPGFMADMMLKDLELAQHAAETVNALIPLGSVATELYKLFVSEGFGEKDFSGIIKLIAGNDNN